MRFMTGALKERIGYDFFCDVAEKIVEGRKAKGWLQPDLAKATGLSVSKISDMENVKIRFKLEDLVLLSEALEVSVNWLIDAQLDCNGETCRYLVWNERLSGVDGLKHKGLGSFYMDATSARMAYLKVDALLRKSRFRFLEPRDRAIVKLVGVPVTKADLEARFRKRTDDSDDKIEPDREEDTNHE